MLGFQRLAGSRIDMVVFDGVQAGSSGHVQPGMYERPAGPAGRRRPVDERRIIEPLRLEEDF
jgi:hypothetical protein